MIEVCDNTILETHPELSFQKVEYDVDGSYLKQMAQIVHLEEDSVLIFGVEEMIKHKRKCFSYEQERRAYLQNIENEYEDYNGKIYLPFSDVSLLISDVMVHPLATKEYEKLIGSICEKFSIHYSGKSKILELDMSQG